MSNHKDRCSYVSDVVMMNGVPKFIHRLDRFLTEQSYEQAVATGSMWCKECKTFTCAVHTGKRGSVECPVCHHESLLDVTSALANDHISILKYENDESEGLLGYWVKVDFQYRFLTRLTRIMTKYEFDEAFREEFGWCIKCKAFVDNDTNPEGHVFWLGECSVCKGESVIGTLEALVDGEITVKDSDSMQSSTIETLKNLLDELKDAIRKDVVYHHSKTDTYKHQINTLRNDIVKLIGIKRKDLFL